MYDKELLAQLSQLGKQRGFKLNFDWLAFLLASAERILGHAANSGSKVKALPDNYPFCHLAEWEATMRKNIATARAIIPHYCRAKTLIAWLIIYVDECLGAFQYDEDVRELLLTILASRSYFDSSTCDYRPFPQEDIRSMQKILTQVVDKKTAFAKLFTPSTIKFCSGDIWQDMQQHLETNEAQIMIKKLAFSSTDDASGKRGQGLKRFERDESMRIDRLAADRPPLLTNACMRKAMRVLLGFSECQQALINYQALRKSESDTPYRFFSAHPRSKSVKLIAARALEASLAKPQLTVDVVAKFPENAQKALHQGRLGKITRGYHAILSVPSFPVEPQQANRPGSSAIIDRSNRTPNFEC